MRAHPARPPPPAAPSAASTSSRGPAAGATFPKPAASCARPFLLSRPRGLLLLARPLAAYQDGGGDGYGRASESRGRGRGGGGGPGRRSDGGGGGGAGRGTGRGGGGRGGRGRGRGRGRANTAPSSRRPPTAAAPPGGDDFVIIGRATAAADAEDDGDDGGAAASPQQRQGEQGGGGGGYAAARAAALAADPRLDGAAFWAAALGEDEDEDEGEDGWEDDEEDDEEEGLDDDDGEAMLSPAALMAELGLLGEEEEEEEEDGEEGAGAGAGAGADAAANTAAPRKQTTPTTTTPTPTTTTTNWRDVYTSSSLPKPFVHPSARLTRVGNGQGRGVVAAAPVAAGEPLIVAAPLGTVLYCEQGTTPENEELAAHLLLGPGRLGGGADAALRFFAKPLKAGGGGGGGKGGKAGSAAAGGAAAAAAAAAALSSSSSPAVSRAAAELLLRYLAPAGPAGSAEGLPLPPRELWEAAAGVEVGGAAADADGDDQQQQQAPLAELLRAFPPDPAVAAAEQVEEEEGGAEGGDDNNSAPGNNNNNNEQQQQQRALARFASLVGANALGEASEDAALAVLRGTALCASGFLALWPAAGGLLNHSCAPTCCWLLIGDRLVVRAARPLAPGDQATLSYLGQALTRPLDERRAELREVYGFECRCERCRAEEKARDKAPESLARALDAVSKDAAGLAARAEAAAARLDELSGAEGAALDGAAWGDDEAAMASTGDAAGVGSSREEEEEHDDRRPGSASSSRSRSRSRTPSSRRRPPTELELQARRARLDRARRDALEELRSCQAELQAMREAFERGLKEAGVKRGSAARLWLVASAFDVYDALSVCADALAPSSSSEEAAEAEVPQERGEEEGQEAEKMRRSKSRRADAKKARAAAAQGPPPLETELLATCARALSAVAPGSEPACALAVELMLRAEARWRGQGAQEARDAARLAAAQHGARYGPPGSLGAATSALLLDTRAGLE